MAAEPPLGRALQEGHELLSPTGQLMSCFLFQGCFNTPQANRSKKWDDVSGPVHARMGSLNSCQ